MARRSKRKTQDELNKIVSQNLSDSTWADDAEVRAFQRTAMGSYYGRRTSKDTDGLSDAQSSDFADLVESTTAQVVPAYDYDEVAAFDPTGANDVDQARIESQVCNSMLNSRAGYTVLQEAVRNALMLRNGIVKVWTERRVDVRTKSYVDLDPLEFAQTTTETAPDQTIEVLNAETTEDGITASVRRTTRFKRLEIKSVDPIEFFLTENWDRTSLRDVPFCGEHYYLTRSDLIGLGVKPKRIEGLKRADGQQVGQNYTWNVRNRGETDPIISDHGDPAMALYEAFEIYMLLDNDGDGTAERRRLLYVGDEVLFNDPFPHVPYASGTGFLQPQRWMGMSLWDKLAELQKNKTEALRQYFDNMAYANNSEVVVLDGAVEIDDLKARRPGGINRADDINAVKDLQVNDHGPSSLALLNYLDKVRAERGGASLDMQSAEAQVAAPDTAHGAERQYTSREALARLITRTLGETLVRELFLLIHGTLVNDFPEGAMAQIGAREFVPYQPGAWPLRLDVTILAGMSYHERLERRQALESVLIQQEKIIQAGFGDGILADMRTYYDALTDWTAAGGVQSTRRYWIDPRSPESQQAQQMKQRMQQLTQQQQQAQQEQFLATQAAVAQSQQMIDLIQDQSKLRFDYWKETLQSAQEEQSIDAQYGTSEGEPAQVDELQGEGAQRASA